MTIQYYSKLEHKFRWIEIIFLSLFLTSSLTAQKSNDAKALERKIARSDSKEKINLSITYFNNYLSLKPRKSILIANDILQIAKSIKDTSAIVQILKSTAAAQFRLGKMEESLSNLEKADRLCHETRDSINLAKVYKTYGSYFARKGDHQSAITYYTKAAALSKVFDLESTYYTAKNGIAISYQRLGNYLKSLEIYDTLFHECYSSDYDCTPLFINKAIALNNISKPSEALALFLKVKAMYSDDQDSEAVITINHHIGYLLNNVGLYDEALEYYLEVLDKVNKNENDFRQLSTIHESIGLLYLRTNQFKFAKIFYEKALKLKTKNGVTSIAYILSNLSFIALEQKQFDQAKVLVDKAILTFEAGDNMKGTAFAYFNLARYYHAKGDIAQAMIYAKKSLNLNSRLQINHEIIRTCDFLSLLHAELKEYDSSLLFRQKADSLNQLIISTKELSTIIRQILSENDSLANSTNDSSPQRQTHIAYISFTVLLSLLSYIFYRKARLSTTKKKKEESLDEKEAEILQAKLNTLMDEQKPFLNQNLTLVDLASLLNTSQKKLSLLLNKHSDTNFYDFINAYRIAQFKLELTNEENNAYSIVGLANNCGFKSKSSFYRLFKRHSGCSPAEYRKSIST